MRIVGKLFGYLILASLLLIVPAVAATPLPGRIWTRIRPGAEETLAYDTVQDRHSNVYVAGCTDGPFDGQTNSTAAGYDAFLIKWDAAGNRQWTRIWGSTNEDEYVYSVALEGTSFAYVVGGTYGAFDGQTNNGDWDAFMTKWRWDGTKEWTRIWGSTNADEAKDVAVNAFKDVVVCGYTAGMFGGQTNNGETDLFLTEFNTNGVAAWSKIWGSPGADDANGVGLLDDNDRSIYVAGLAAGPILGQPEIGGGDLCLSLWSARHGGSHVWTRIWGSTQFENSYGGLAVASNAIAVAGVTLGAYDGQTNPCANGAACVSYWTNGPTRCWSRIFGPTNASSACGAGLGDAGDIYVSGVANAPFNGWTNAPGGFNNLFLCAFDPAGSGCWTRIWGSISNDAQEGRCHVLGRRIAVSFYASRAGFDGQDVPFGPMRYHPGVSMYEPNYAPTAVAVERGAAGDVVAWQGAWDCQFDFAASTNLNGQGGWQTNNLPNSMPGAERLSVTNANAASPRFYRAVARPLLVAPVYPADDMVLIPAGAFVMGAAGIATPVHTNYLSAFWMDAKEVTKAQWDEVRVCGTAHGFTVENAGNGKATNHPVQSVDWYNVVKWANARSEMSGRTPCYYTNSGFTTGAVYRSGHLNLSNEWVSWDADGYRLPTEAEWEKAARGGVAGRLFPWGGDTITHTQANYNSTNAYAYDISATRGFNPAFTNGGFPCTAPVGSFAANAYGLRDMAGNVGEWIWDWYDAGYYAVSPTNDPRGPATGTYRCWRGGTWYIHAPYARVADRNFYLGGPGGGDDTLGFRCVRRNQ